MGQKIGGLFAVLCALMQTSQSQALAADSTWMAQVVFVSDGDTLWVRRLRQRAGAAHLGPSQKLRLKGIDAPETCQQGGVASRNALAGLVLNRFVRVHAQGRDTYGRRLARIDIDGVDVGAALLEQGWAWVYWKESRRQGFVDVYEKLEQGARIHHRGVFAQTDPMHPKVFRKYMGPCP